MAVVRGDHHGTEGNLSVAASTLKRDVVDKIFDLQPDLAGLTLLMRKARSNSKAPKSAKSFKHEWPEQERIPTITQINNSGGYTSGAVSIAVDDGTVFAVNDLLQVQRTNETMLITAVSTNTLTVTRSWGTIAAAALLDNDYVLALGGAALEGADAELGRARQDDWKYNLTQIFRDPYGVTRTLQNTDTYGEPELPKLRLRRGWDHKIKIELASFFGERVSVTSGDEPRRSMGGLWEFITTNTTDFNGIMTWEEIVQAAESDFMYGSDVKLLFGAPAVSTGVALIAKEHMRTAPSDKTFGLKISRINAQHGEYMLMKHRLFEGAEYAKVGFVVDPMNVAYVPLQNSDTHLKKNIQSTSADAVKEEWLTECTLERVQERTHGLWTEAA